MHSIQKIKLMAKLQLWGTQEPHYEYSKYIQGHAPLGWGYASTVEHYSSIAEAHGLIPSTHTHMHTHTQNQSPRMTERPKDSLACTNQLFEGTRKLLATVTTQ